MEIEDLKRQCINLSSLIVDTEAFTAEQLDALADRPLLRLIAQNTEALERIQTKLYYSADISEIKMLSESFAALADAQSKLVAIAQQQHPDVKCIFKYAKYITDKDA